MSEQHHIIHRQQIRITCEEQDNAHYLLDEISRINKTRLIPLLSRLLDELVPPDQTLRIDSLQLDLGQVRTASLERDLSDALYKALQTAMPEHLEAAAKALPTDKQQADREIEAIKTYLHSGQLPWWQSKYTRASVSTQMDDLLRHRPDPAIALIREAGSKALVRRRLAMQFPEATLQEIIRLLEKGNYALVLAYIAEVMRIEEQKPIIRRSKPEVKTALYEFVLSYLLTERGSRFNTRSFVGSTLRQMAARFHMSYLSLLTLLGEAVREVGTTSVEWRSTLPGLIQELHEEAILGESPAGPEVSPAQSRAPEPQAPEQLSPDRLVAILRHYLLHGSIAWQDQETVKDLPEVLFQQLLLRHPRQALSLLRETVQTSTQVLDRIARHFSPFSLRKLLGVLLGENTRQWLDWMDTLGKAWEVQITAASHLSLESLLWRIVLQEALRPRAAEQTTFAQERLRLWQALVSYSGLSIRDWTDWAKQHKDISIPAALRKHYREQAAELDKKQVLDIWVAWNEGLPTRQLSSSGYKTAAAVLEALVSESPEALAEWYRQAWPRAEALARRAARELDDPALHSLVHLRQPEASETIIRYTDLLQEQHKAAPLSNQSASAYRQATWELVLTALWSDRGSVFNTRSFIKSTIHGMAQRLGTDYRSLLKELSKGLNALGSTGGRQQQVLQYLRDIREEEERRSPLSLPWPLGPGEEEHLLQSPDYRADRLFRLLSQAEGDKRLSSQEIQQEMEALAAHPVLLDQIVAQHLRRPGTHPALLRPDQKAFALLLRQKAGAQQDRVKALQDKFLDLMARTLPKEKAALLSPELLQGWTLQFLYSAGNAPFRESEYLRHLIEKTQSQLRLVPNRMAHYLSQWEGRDKEIVHKLAAEVLPKEKQEQFLSPEKAFAQATASDKSPTDWLRQWLDRDPEKTGKVLAQYLELSGMELPWLLDRMQESQRRQLLAMLIARHMPALGKVRQQLELILSQMRLPRLAGKDMETWLLRHFLTYLQAPRSREKNLGHYIQHLLHWLAAEEGAGIGGIRFMARAALSQSGNKVGTQLKALLSFRPQAADDPPPKVQKPKTTEGNQQINNDLDYYGKDKKDSRELGEPIFVHNAGMVLAWSFLPMLFRRLDYLTPVNKFKDESYAYRAVHLLEYLATGQEGIPEYMLVLNKILCGIDQAQPITKDLQLTEQEKSTADSLLEHGLMANWKVLKSTTAEGLRESFLFREGKLSPATEAWYLTVDKKPFDMLIDYISWKIDLVKLAWMDKPIYVTWR